MKKYFLFLVGMLLVSANMFCQEPLTKDQKKKADTIQKETTKELNSIVADTQMSAVEKKGKVQLLKIDRDARLAEFMANAQLTTILVKDPVKWDTAVKQIDKNESSKLKKEKQGRLDEISSQQKDLDRQMSELDRQIKDLKSKQGDIKKQQKILNDRKKEIKNEYK